MLLDYKAVGVELILPAAKASKEEQMPKNMGLSRNNPNAISAKSFKKTNNSVSSPKHVQTEK